MKEAEGTENPIPVNPSRNRKTDAHQGGKPTGRQEDGGAAPMESAVPVTVMVTVTEQVTKEGNGLGEAGLPLEAEEWSEGADPGGTMVPSEQGFNYRSRAFREDTPHPSALQRGKSKEQFRSWVLGGGEGEATGLLPARDSASMVSTGGQAVAFMGWAGSSWRQLTGVCFLHLGVHGAGAGGSCLLCFCSEATFQDDVVAVIAFSCKREMLRFYRKKSRVLQHPGRPGIRVPAATLP